MFTVFFNLKPNYFLCNLYDVQKFTMLAFFWWILHIQTLTRIFYGTQLVKSGNEYIHVVQKYSEIKQIHTLMSFLNLLLWLSYISEHKVLFCMLELSDLHNWLLCSTFSIQGQNFYYKVIYINNLSNHYYTILTLLNIIWCTISLD